MGSRQFANCIAVHTAVRLDARRRLRIRAYKYSTLDAMGPCTLNLNLIARMSKSRDRLSLEGFGQLSV